MKLGTINIATPRLIFDVEVQHSSKRTLTVFERTILSLYERFKQDESYGVLPLQQIFVEILGVPDSSDFLSYSLSELIAIRVIKCQKSISEVNAISLRDIAVTERGAAMIKDNQLPSVIRKNKERIVFDPISKRFSKYVDTELGKEAGNYRLDAAPFMGITPLESIRNYIVEQKFTWIDEESSIDNVSVTNESIGWLHFSTDVFFDGRKVDIVFQDDDYNRYVSSLPSASILGYVIGNELFSISREIPETSNFLYEENDNGSALEHLLPLGYVLNKYCKNSQVWLINSQGVLWDSHLQVPPGKVFISFHPEGSNSNVKLTWNKTTSGCHIKISGVFPFEGHDMVIDGYLIKLLDSEVTVGQDTTVLSLTKVIASEAAHNVWIETINYVEKSLIEADDLNDRLSPILWLSKNIFWDQYMLKVASHCTTFNDIVELLDKTRNMEKRQWGSIDAMDFTKASKTVIAEYHQRVDMQYETVRKEISDLSKKYHWLGEIFL